MRATLTWYPESHGVPIAEVDLRFTVDRHGGLDIECRATWLKAWNPTPDYWRADAEKFIREKHRDEYVEQLSEARYGAEANERFVAREG